MSVPGFMPQFSGGAAGASIEYVGGVADVGESGGNAVLDLTGIAGLAEGDIVIVSGGFTRNAVPTTPAGWTEIVNYRDSDSCALVFYKIMGGTPDTAVTAPSSGDSRDACAYVALAFRGVDQSTPFDATAELVEELLPVTPGAITTVTSKAMIVIYAGLRTTDGALTPPAGYPAFTEGETLAIGIVGRDQVSTMTYKEASTVGVNAPGAYSDWTTDQSDPVIAVTMALRPA